MNGRTAHPQHPSTFRVGARAVLLVLVIAAIALTFFGASSPSASAQDPACTEGTFEDGQCVIIGDAPVLVFDGCPVGATETGDEQCVETTARVSLPACTAPYAYDPAANVCSYVVSVGAVPNDCSAVPGTSISEDFIEGSGGTTQRCAYEAPFELSCPAGYTPSGATCSRPITPRFVPTCAGGFEFEFEFEEERCVQRVTIVTIEYDLQCTAEGNVVITDFLITPGSVTPFLNGSSNIGQALLENEPLAWSAFGDGISVTNVDLIVEGPTTTPTCSEPVTPTVTPTAIATPTPGTAAPTPTTNQEARTPTPPPLPTQTPITEPSPTAPVATEEPEVDATPTAPARDIPTEEPTTRAEAIVEEPLTSPCDPSQEEPIDPDDWDADAISNNEDSEPCVAATDTGPETTSPPPNVPPWLWPLAAGVPVVAATAWLLRGPTRTLSRHTSAPQSKFAATIASAEPGECDRDGVRPLRLLARLDPPFEGALVQWFIDGQPVGSPVPIGEAQAECPGDGAQHVVTLTVLSPPGATGSSQTVECPECESKVVGEIVSSDDEPAEETTTETEDTTPDPGEPNESTPTTNATKPSGRIVSADIGRVD